MIIPVKLRPFDEWPNACACCRTTGYESLFTERQTQRLSGLWMEIDTGTEQADDIGERRRWQATRESWQRLTDIQGVFPGMAISEEDAKRMSICEHMIDQYTLYTGRVRACLHRMGFVRLPKNKPPEKPADPLVGKLFLSIGRCGACGASRVDGRGEVLERIPGTDAYLVEPFAFGEKVIRAGFVQRVMGHLMSDWRFYDSIMAMTYDEQSLNEIPHQHQAQAERPN
jgi:hypothetical protein